MAGDVYDQPDGTSYRRKDNAMAVPDVHSCMRPLLQFTGDGKEHTLPEARQVLSAQFQLSAEDLKVVMGNGQRLFDNHVSWAKIRLTQAGLLISPRPKFIQITEQGLAALAQDPPPVPPKPPCPKDETPDEILERAYQQIRAALAAELLGLVKAGSPHFFERLVVELLLKMGYGRNRAEAGRAIGGVGDGGIDGVIHEDRLGLDTIYIQAKRWEATVGRPEIQKFVGALQHKRARKGVFLTTGSFSAEAVDSVSHSEPHVALIDGRQLVEYMLDLNVGVTTRATYELKRIDSDYFTEE